MKRGEHRVKEVSDFLKIAYKYNKVRDIKEAFEEFPIEEEWHKGKIENVLREETVTYGVEYEIGDIVFVKEYMYSNGKAGNNHFFVIIDKDNTAVPIENFGMLLSSNLDKLRFKTNNTIPVIYIIIVIADIVSLYDIAPILFNPTVNTNINNNTRL